MRYYLIVADNRGEMILCEGDGPHMQALAERFRRALFFRYVRVSRSPQVRGPAREPHGPHHPGLHGPFPLVSAEDGRR